jgi:hypothetical protein
MAKNLTKRDLFGMVFDVIADSDSPDKDMLCDFVAYEVALLDRKAAAPKRNPEAEAAREAVTAILDAAEAPMRAGEIAEVAGLTIQRVTAALKAINANRVEEGKVVRFTK